MHELCSYAKTLKMVALQALDAGLISVGYAWIGMVGYALISVCCMNVLDAYM